MKNHPIMLIFAKEIITIRFTYKEGFERMCIKITLHVHMASYLACLCIEFCTSFPQKPYSLQILPDLNNYVPQPKGLGCTKVS